MYIKKLLFSILFLIAACSVNAKAIDCNNFNYPIPLNLKIAAIDKAINDAKSFEEIKEVVEKISAFVLENLYDTCPAPLASDYKAIFGDVAARTKAPENEIDYYEYYYEKRIWALACINIGLDNEEIVKKKLQLFWNKYKTSFKCDTLDFALSNGNLLKYALSQHMPLLIGTLAETYGLDINFIDPKDGLNLLDYINAEIAKLKAIHSEASLKVWEEYRTRVIDVGGKSVKK